MSTTSPVLDYRSPDSRLRGLALVASQTWALLVDEYRSLNSRLLFWIALGLSALVALVFAAIGFGPDGITFFGYHASSFPNTSLYPAGDFYKSLFLEWGVGVWITWVATILALITTAGIFPDLISGGSIDLYLSKPLGRLRLFLTKYIAGLMFVALQILVFCFACFLVIGIRGGVWAPSIFIAVPVVTLYYSFLFCVAVFVGMFTGSTLASLLVTLLFWFCIFILNAADGSLLAFKTVFQVDAQGYEARIARNEATVNRWEENPEAAPGEIYQRGIRELLEKDREALAQQARTAEQLDFWHTWVLRAKAPLPKTSESIDILRRWLIESDELAPTQTATVAEPLSSPGQRDALARATTQPEEETDEQRRERRRRENPAEMMNSPVVQQNVRASILSRSATWAFGTSILFEIVVLAVTAWSFVRRDF